MTKDDIYLSMLRFGKMKLGDGFTIQQLVDYLGQRGFKNISPHSNIFHQYFFKIYFSKENEIESAPHYSEWFYLRPECYMQLLEYDNMLTTRKEAKLAMWCAIIAIVLTLGSLIVSIVK